MKNRHINIFAAALAAILCLGACELEAPAIFITVATTFDAEDITEESAVLKGGVRLPDTLPDDTRYGFLLSAEESVVKSMSQEIVVFSKTPVEEEATKADDGTSGEGGEGSGDGSATDTEEPGAEVPAPLEFSAKVVGFESGTTYYFRSFALCGGFYSYGAVVSFTTAGTPKTEEPAENPDPAEPGDDDEPEIGE